MPMLNNHANYMTPPPARRKPMMLQIVARLPTFIRKISHVNSFMSFWTIPLPSSYMSLGTIPHIYLFCVGKILHKSLLLGVGWRVGVG